MYKTTKGGWRMSRKFLYGMGALITTLGLFVGCGSEQPVEPEKQETSTGKPSTEKEEKKETPKEEAKEEKGETKKEERRISAIVQQSRNYPGLQAMIQKLADEENIIIDLQIAPDDQYNNLLQMKINSGESPDLIDYNIPALYGLIDPETYLMDLTGEAWTQNLLSPEIVTHSDDKIYGFPFQANSGVQGMIYNKDVFEANGLDIPTTVEEFDAVCEALIAKGVTPIMLPADSWVPQIWMSSGFSRALGTVEDCEAFQEKIMTNQATLQDYPELAEVLEHYLSMFEKGFINEDYLTVSYDAVLDRLSKGEGAMLYGASPILATIEGIYPEIPFGMFSMPTPFDETDVMSGGLFSIGFGVAKDTKNAETVKEVLNLWATPEYLDLWFEGNAGFPAFPGINGGDQNQDVVALFNSYQEGGRLVGEMNNYLNDLQPLFKPTLWVYYLDAPAKGTSGEEILAKFQEDITKYMKEKKAPGF